MWCRLGCGALLWKAFGTLGVSLAPPVLTYAVMHVPLPHAELCGWAFHGRAHGCGFTHVKRAEAGRVQPRRQKVVRETQGELMKILQRAWIQIQFRPGTEFGVGC